MKEWACILSRLTIALPSVMGSMGACVRNSHRVGENEGGRHEDASTRLKGLAGVHALQVRAQGQYINDKIDLLIEYLFVEPFQALYRRVFKHEVELST